MFSILCIFVHNAKKKYLMKHIWSLGNALFLLMLFIVPTSCSEDVTPPVAAFTFSPTTASITEPVTFDASSSDPGSCDNCYIIDYYWDFNSDGTWDEITDNSVISYQFYSENTYDVSLKVRNSQGYTSSEDATMQVEVGSTSSSDNNAPSEPVLSYPSNGSIDVEVLPTFAWSSVDPDGDPLLYDIYIGTTETPQLVKSNNETSTYTPSADLEENTTYFWRVIVTDGDSDVASDVYQFTTEGTGPGANRAPNAPTDPYPESLSENRPINQQLEWECSDPNGDELTYDIYFGETENPTLKETDYAYNSYVPSSDLDQNTTYYWYIVARDPYEEETASEVWSFTTGSNDLTCPSSLTDSRDNAEYAVVQIGTQCWMAENLNYGEMIVAGDPSQNTTTEKRCYNSNESNCDTYGALYAWDEMMNYTDVEEAGGICPDGWHIPSETEWHTLVDYLGGNFKAGKYLKEDGSSGFEAMMSGTYSDSDLFLSIDLKGYYWTSTKFDSEESLQIHFDSDLDGVYYNYRDTDYSNAVRCIKD